MEDSRDPKLEALADIIDDHVKDAVDAFKAANGGNPAVLVICAHGTAVEISMSCNDSSAMAHLLHDIAAEWLAEPDGDDCFVPSRAERMA
jgi:hypothetical protein